MDNAEQKGVIGDGMTHSRLKNDGSAWRDANWEYTHKGTEKPLTEEEVNVETSWEVTTFEDVRVGLAKEMLMNEDTIPAEFVGE